jgi:hypothetical protein
MDPEGFMAFYPYFRHHFPRCSWDCWLRGRTRAPIRAPLIAMVAYRGSPRTPAFVWTISHSAVSFLCVAPHSHFSPRHPHRSSKK